jgi:hypothetical protein
VQQQLRRQRDDDGPILPHGDNGQDARDHGTD